MKSTRRTFIKATASAGIVSAASPVFSAEKKKAGGKVFNIQRRSRKKTDAGFVPVEESVSLDADRTALVICDMWDLHHCKNAVDRVGELAPRINSLTNHLRKSGVTIIHAPSSCMDYYKSHGARLRVKDVPDAGNAPSDISQWCNWMPGGEEQKNYPIDQSDGGCDSDPVEQKAFKQWLIDQGKNAGAPWTHQIKVIEMDPNQDYISDHGVEIWNIMEHHKISNVLLVGVHTNMCVLGRPFGLRQMSINKKNVHLVRDLTDTMYNPQMSPFVSHFDGTRLIIEHIENYVCPTTTSNQFLGGDNFQFRKFPDQG